MNKNTPCILVIDDDRTILKQLRDKLAEDGYEIYTAESGEEALEKVIQSPIDLIVLDMMLPAMSGLEVCQWVRKRVSRYLPIIIISGAGNEADKTKALSLGANDYVAKPFSMSMFRARIKAHLHNHQPVGPVFIDGPLKVNFLEHDVYVNGHEVQLQPIEYNILKILIENKGRLITPDALAYKLSPDEDDLHSAIEVGIHRYGEKEIATFIHNLRRKIERPAQHRFIITHHHMGYRFKMEDETQA